MGSSITIQGLGFAYERNRPVIDQCSLTLESPTHVGIIGPNGSGKSTLFKLLIRLLAPTSGEIRLDDKPLAHYTQAEIAKQIAIVPQELDIVFPFRCIDVVMMGRSPYLGRFALDRPEDGSIVEAAMRFTHCLEFAHRPITELSGGERQRVWVARALAQQTPILLLDEPANHLDLNYQWKMLDWIHAWVAEEKKLVLSTLHHLDHAKTCDQIILWKQGKVFRQGSQELLTRPLLDSLFS